MPRKILLEVYCVAYIVYNVLLDANLCQQRLQY